ncbi:MAG: isoprenylcysteine carboxylmethyltransferase family protein [Spirochaetales bacterium]|nr:isoprenylcysteine carboxylmethyltransferase family protein [Spirochaetales bacterium]
MTGGNPGPEGARGETRHGAGHGARHDRSHLAGEHAFTDVGQLILLAIFLAVWVTDSFLFRYSLIGAAVVPVYVRIPLGVAALAAAAALALPAHKAVFGNSDREPGLVTGGVFARVRHPMYLGSWLLPVALTLLTGSVAAAAVCVVILLFYLGVSRHEERLLLEKHGAAYREYMGRVPWFFPLRLRRRDAKDRSTP